VGAIGIDPARPEFMLVGSRRGIHRSTDGGKTWAEGATVRGRLLGFHFDQTSPAGKRTCFAATDQTFLRSDDDGVTWRDIPTGFGSAPILSSAGGSHRQSGACVLYCSVESRETSGQLTGGIYRSEDRGTTWTRAMGSGIDERRERRTNAAGAPAQYEFVLTTDVDPARVYASQGSAGRVFRSDDRGATWRSVLIQSMKLTGFNVGPNYLIDERGGGGDYISGFGINPADPDHVIVTDWMDCLITRDGGKTWDAAHTRSAELPGRRGKAMRWIHTGLVVTTVWNYYLDPFEPNRHYIAYTDIGYARSTDAGQTWFWQMGRPLRNTTYELAFDPETPGEIWGAFADLHDIPNNNVISGRHYRPPAAGGASWTRIARKGTECFGATVHPRKPGWVYLCITESAPDAGLWLSKDAGKSWTALEGLPFRNAQRVTFDPKDDSVIYVSTFGGSVWKGPAEP
jgi:photosystem II stability/assembly factor-like uncharacterized protein